MSSGTLPAISEIHYTDISGPVIIRQPGYYRLTGNIRTTNTTGKQYQLTCIEIRSSGVVFDGMGYTLDGSLLHPQAGQVSEGLIIDRWDSTNPVRNVTIRNVTVSNWRDGFSFRGVRDLTAENVRAVDNEIGIFLIASSNISISNSDLESNGEGVEGQDVEKISIVNSTIAHSKKQAVFIDGRTQQSVYFSFGPIFYVFPAYQYVKTTSGNGHIIAYNKITDNKLGVYLRNSDNILVTGNDFSGTSENGNVVSLINCGSDIVGDDVSGNGNAVQRITYPDTQPVAVIFGTVLIILFKVFANAINIGVDIITRPLKGKYFFSPADAEKTTNGDVRYIFNRQLPSFTRNNVFESVIGAIILGGAYAYAEYTQIDLFTVGILTLIAGVVIVTHEFVHFLMAQRMGIRADFRIWGAGVIITLLTSVLVKNVFGQTVLTKIQNEDECDRKKIALVMLSGPFISLILSSGFYALYLMQGRYASLALFGFEMSLMTAFLSFLPFKSLDGERVYKWNKLIWGAAFIPLYLAYGYFYIYQDVWVLLIPIVIGAILFGIRRLHILFFLKYSITRMSKWTKYLLISCAVFLVSTRLYSYFSYWHYNGFIDTGTPLNDLVVLITFVLRIATFIVMIISLGALIAGYFHKK